ncbi:glycosyltransferase family 4 protein [Calothrix sp. 336/3]|uniref:glycosyltransferase family 4 protein n=1 Tax=Calothrix sp. 336/3 TaxID=1337936 RepID=UPI0004E363A9|nr:glycosyltransferase family 4 protein [Calothrix sp. 336/3]AKG23988.1 glycosyltransferase [Calothrix sp. 336/3]
MTISEWINQKLSLSNLDQSETGYKGLGHGEKSVQLSVITQFFPPDFAATGQLLEELVKHLGKMGINVEVFTSQPGYAFHSQKALHVERKGRVLVHRSRTAQLWPKRVRGKAINGVLFTLRAALHLLRNGRKFNVVLLTTAPPFAPILGLIAHWLFRLPYVCIVYDLYPDIAIALGVVSKKHPIVSFWQGINSRLWRKAKRIIVLSPGMKEKVIATYPEAKDKISVIHSWSDPDWIIPIAKEENWFAWKHHLVRKFTVLYSGNMGRCHDIETMLKAAQELQNEPVQFVCIGGGAKKEELIQEVLNLGLNNFIFLPYQDKEILPYSLTACDLSLVSVDAGMESYVAPSKFYPILATGRPVAAICSESSDLRQMVSEAKCGRSFENGDGKGLAEFIRLLYQQPELAQGMGQDGRKYMRSHFTLDIIAHRYLDILYQSII